MYAVYAIGFLGQVFFALRMLLQWIASERAGRSVVPRGFWELSLLGGICALTYGLLRRDAPYLLVVLPSLFVYTRNLFIRRQAAAARLWPIAGALVLFLVWAAVARPVIISPFWTAIGAAGSLVFTSRFVVQWWVSERRGESVLPIAFWVLSLAGCGLLLAYACARRDPVLIAAFLLSPIPYVRNLLFLRQRK